MMFESSSSGFTADDGLALALDASLEALPDARDHLSTRIRRPISRAWTYLFSHFLSIISSICPPSQTINHPPAGQV